MSTQENNEFDESIAEMLGQLTPVGKEHSNEPRKDNSSVESVAPHIFQILLSALADHASEIHLEPFLDTVVVRYCIDGQLQERQALPKYLLGGLIQRIREMNNIQMKRHQQAYHLRVETLPVELGEKVIIFITPVTA